MNSKHDRPSTQRSWPRIGLLFLTVTSFSGGLWALFMPRPFYEGFPLPGWDWVSTLGSYNEHLVRDYGALNLALGVLLVAASFLERRLVQAPLVTGSPTRCRSSSSTSDRHATSRSSTTWRSLAHWEQDDGSNWSYFFSRMRPSWGVSGGRRGMQIPEQEKGMFHD